VVIIDKYVARTPPSRHRFFLVSLCPKANAEMVPKVTSCHYVPLM